MDNKSVNRLNYVDVVKGIGILLVVFQHCMGVAPFETTPFISYMIKSFWMPLFFFMSGYLYKIKPTREYFYSKTRTLIIPDIIVKVINVFTGIFCLSVLRLSDNYLKLEGFWFLDALILISLFYYLFNCTLLNFKFIKNEHIQYYLFSVSVILLVLGLAFSHFAGKNTYSVISAFVGVFYYSLGHIFRLFENKKEIIKKRYIYLIISILMLTALAFIAPYTGDISMAYNKYSNEVVFVICSVIGCFAIFFLSKFIKKSKFLEYYGRNSLIILTLQFPLFKGANMLLCRFSDNLSPIIIALINFAFCFIALNALIPLINKLFPLYAGKIKNEIS